MINSVSDSVEYQKNGKKNHQIIEYMVPEYISANKAFEDNVNKALVLKIFKSLPEVLIKSKV